MGPNCCENCKSKTGDTCGRFRTCPSWRAWFHKEWDGIQRAVVVAKRKLKEAEAAKNGES